MKHSMSWIDVSRNFPYPTHQPACLSPLPTEALERVFYSNFPTTSNSVSFIISYFFLLHAAAALMFCMINGMKDFDHVGKFYVSWISKKSKAKKKNSRFIIAQQRNLRALRKRILMRCWLPEKLQTIAVAEGIFGKSQKGDNANGAKIFPSRDGEGRSGEQEN